MWNRTEDYVREKGGENIMDGYYDNLIIELIKDGRFDKWVKERTIKLNDIIK